MNTWTFRSGVENIVWTGVAWSPELGLFVAVGNSGENPGGTPRRVATSSDGTNWTFQETPGDSIAWTGVAWSTKAQLFAAVASSGTKRVMTSPDGVEWTLRDSDETVSWRAIAAGTSSGPKAPLIVDFDCEQPRGYNENDVPLPNEGSVFFEKLSFSTHTSPAVASPSKRRTPPPSSGSESANS